ncbi:Acyl-CoA N-acyltransferase [Penicillium sp. CMV-2018d]|nr:Acyl-CoA N-acyltransferase [Penicillium sp. CMV-2018d]
MNPETPQEPQCPGYTLRTHRPGDIGWIIHRHATLYKKEYGWGTKMEALVCKVGAEFLDNYGASTDRCWIAERNDEFLGCIERSSTRPNYVSYLLSPVRGALGLAVL